MLLCLVCVQYLRASQLRLVLLCARVDGRTLLLSFAGSIGADGMRALVR